MKDTILNLGLTDESLDVLIVQSQNARFAYDTYRRFLQMFGVVVLGIQQEKYEEILTRILQRSNLSSEKEMDASHLRILAENFRAITTVPQDPYLQLRMAVEAMFTNWHAPRQYSVLSVLLSFPRIPCSNCDKIIKHMRTHLTSRVLDIYF